MGSLPGNPGAVCIWITLDYYPYRVPGGSPTDWLITVGDPIEVIWYAEGKPATRQQILDSFDQRLPLLQDIAKAQSVEAEQELARQVSKTMALLPA